MWIWQEWMTASEDSPRGCLATTNLGATVLSREQSLLTDQEQSLKPFWRKKPKIPDENGKIFLEARLEGLGENCARIAPADFRAHALNSEGPIHSLTLALALSPAPTPVQATEVWNLLEVSKGGLSGFFHIYELGVKYGKSCAEQQWKNRQGCRLD